MVIATTETPNVLGPAAPNGDNASRSAVKTRAVNRGLTCDQYGIIPTASEIPNPLKVKISRKAAAGGMELRHLRYFVAVGEEQHNGRASRKITGGSAGALSRQIQDLEQEGGFKLFDRLPRGVKLSAAGKLFLDDARRVLQEVSEAAARAAGGI